MREKMLQTAFNQTPLIGILLDQDFRVMHWNASASRILGWSEQEATGKMFFDLLFSSQEDSAQEDSVQNSEEEEAWNPRSIADSQVSHFNRNCLTKKGKALMCEWFITRIMDDAGQLNGYCIQAMDISVRHSVTTALSKSEAELRLVFENSQDAVVWVDPETEMLIKCNRAAEKLFETRRNKLIGQHFSILHPPANYPDHRQFFEKTLQGSAQENIELELISGKGNLIPVLLTSSITRVGEQVVVQGVFRDLRELRKAQDTLRNRESILETLGDVTSRLLLSDDLDSEIPHILMQIGEKTHAHRVYLFERIKDEQHPDEVYVEQKHEWAAPNITPQINNPKLRRFPMLGSGFQALVESFSLGNAFFGLTENFPPSIRAEFQDQGVHSMINVPVIIENDWWGFIGIDDCTRPRLWHSAEVDALRAVANVLAVAIQRFAVEQEREQLIQAVQQAAEAIFIMDSELRLEFVNPAFEQITKYHYLDLIGSKLPLFTSGEKENEFYRELKNNFYENNSWNTRLTTFKRTGEILEAELNISPIVNEGGFYTSYIGVMRDITRDSQREAVMLQQAKHAQIGEMLSIIAHQWRQPLSVISTICGNMLIDLELDDFDDDTFRDYLNEVIKHTQFLSSTINDFRSFTNSKRESTTIRLTEVVDRCLYFIGGALQSAKIQVEKDYRDDITLESMPNELLQVLLDIVKNAKDVIIERNISQGLVTVRVYTCGSFHCLEVEDNAGGIPESIIEHIFLPYFTTKEELNGTGLGLYMAKTIVEGHLKGLIEAKNTKAGACFTIKLPMMNV